MSIDLMRIVRAALPDGGPPVFLQDNRYPRPVSTDPFAAALPAYHVLVMVNGCSANRGPWVVVTYTRRFGFTPIMDDAYAYLEPPPGLDRDTPATIAAWLTPALRAAVTEKALLAAQAKAADAGTPGPVQAWDAIRRIS